MSTISPTARSAGTPPATAELTADTIDALQVGSKVLGHLRIEAKLERGDDAWIFLAADETRDGLVLLVLAASEEAREARLEGAARGEVLAKMKAGTWWIAEVRFEAAHYDRFDAYLFPTALARTGEATRMRGAPPQVGLVKGALFADRYRIDGVLGRGGMGEVYRAYHEKLQRHVALKLVRVEMMESPAHCAEAKRRLLNEARVVSALKHPHIVEIHDAGEHDGLPYLVLELCEGGNLGQAMAEARPLADRIRWLLEVAEALAHAHDRDIVHRDIKPANVLITQDGKAKVADFGIAKALQRDHLAGDSTLGIVGTPRYMAPEQFVGDSVDARADQFSWAVVAYKLLTGEHPRPCEVAVGEGARLPGSWGRVLKRAMSVNRGARYLDFRELLVDLRRPRGRISWAGALAAVGAVTVVFGAIAGGRVVHSASAQASGAPVEMRQAADVPAPFDVAKADAEMVSRCAPEVRAEFSAGMQLWRDASTDMARKRLKKAAELDSECASANLYIAMPDIGGNPNRFHFRRAREHRSRLSERERAILDVLEPWFIEPPNIEEARRRAESISEHVPNDPDVQTLEALALLELERFDDALAVLDRAATARPRPIAGNEFLAAVVQIRRKDTSGALVRFDGCLKIAPDSSDCLVWRVGLVGSAGDCDEAEKAARRAISAMPDNFRGYGFLAQIVLISRHDPAAARELYQETRRHLASDIHTFFPTEDSIRFQEESLIASLAYNPEGALLYLRQWNAEVAESTNGRFRSMPLVELVGLLWDLGYAQEARALVRKAMREYRGWTADMMCGVEPSCDLRIEIPRLAYTTGTIDSEAYRRLRSAWMADAPRLPVDTWLEGFAGLPSVVADMAPPIAIGEYALDWLNMNQETFARAAMDLLRAGRVRDALQHADAAANACLGGFSVGYIHGQLAAAKVHDAVGDVAVACTRYEELRHLFAKSPRSPILQLATTRLKELSCSNGSGGSPR